VLVAIVVFASVYAMVSAVLLLGADHTVALPPEARRALLFVLVCLSFVALLGVVAFSYLWLTAGPAGSPAGGP
jgi:hypothetical protein